MELQNAIEPKKETPTKTLETSIEPPPSSAEPLQGPPLASPSPPPPEAESDAGEGTGGGGGGTEKPETKPSTPEIYAPGSSPTAAGAVTDLEKKVRRAERFGMPVQLSEEERRSSRAERFGTGSTSLGKTDAGKNSTGKEEEEKRKARAERFGLTGQSPPDEEAKKKARLERFAQNPKPDTLEEEKRKARAARFSGTASASEANGKTNSDLKITVAETK